VVLVTAHRRESWGEPLEQVVRAVERIALARPAVTVVVSMHPNPLVRKTFAPLVALGNVLLTEPEPYPAFVRLMHRADLILTDSGGIQEEGPSLGKPVLVLREKTERPEAVEAGTVKLVGTESDTIVRESATLLDCPEEYQRMSRIHNPYGDGHASERIEAAIRDYSRTAG
jgi:UDP-N-acetylglucosamine 2-epimerase (non-hydrolysing)